MTISQSLGHPHTVTLFRFLSMRQPPVLIQWYRLLRSNSVRSRYKKSKPCPGLPKQSGSRGLCDFLVKPSNIGEGLVRVDVSWFVLCAKE